MTTEDLSKLNQDQRVQLENLKVEAKKAVKKLAE